MSNLTNQIINNFLFWLSRKKWLVVAFFTSISLFYATTPEGLTPEGHRTLIIVITALILIVSESIPLPAIAMLIIIMEVVLGIGSPDEVASSFMSDAVFFIMGSLMLAVSIVHQGLDKRLALSIINITGNKTWRIAAGFVFISALMSSFIGEHTVAAMMLPVALALIRYSGYDSRQSSNLSSLLLFSIAYGCAIGSIGTPSGGGRNAIMIGYFSEFNIASISYWQWMKYTYPMMLIEIPVAAIVLWFTFTPRKRILDSAVRKLKVNVAKDGSLSISQLLSIFIFFIVFLAWIFLSPIIGLGVIALIGVFFYLSFRLIEWQELTLRTNWGVVLLFGSAISLGIQMNETGAAKWLADTILFYLQNIIGNVSIVRWSFSVLVSAILTNLLSNAATVAILGPIVLDMGGNPVILGLSTSIASAFAYLTVVASPTCMIIYSTGIIRSKDYFKAGWKLFIVSLMLLMLISIFYWPVLS